MRRDRWPCCRSRLFPGIGREGSPRMGMNYCDKCKQKYIDISVICYHCHTPEECEAAFRRMWIFIGILMGLLLIASPFIILLDWLLGPFK